MALKDVTKQEALDALQELMEFVTQTGRHRESGRGGNPYSKPVVRRAATVLAALRHGKATNAGHSWVAWNEDRPTCS